MNDLTLDELRIMCGVFARLEEITGLDTPEQEINNRLLEARDEREELESMDFNDCGDSCKI